MNQKRDESNRPARPRGLQPPVLLWLTLVWVAFVGRPVGRQCPGRAGRGAGRLPRVPAAAVADAPPRATTLAGLARRPIPGGRRRGERRGGLEDPSVSPAATPCRIEVDLRTHSDFVLTIVAEIVSLVPGSLVVEARRATDTLFLHALDARDTAGVDKMRKQVSHSNAGSSSRSGPRSSNSTNPPEEERKLRSNQLTSLAASVSGPDTGDAPQLPPLRCIPSQPRADTALISGLACYLTDCPAVRASAIGC